jgi:hypothetical protein
MNCIKCGKKAYKVYKPDLDVTGIGMCSEHQEEVTLDLMIANYEDDGWVKFKNKYDKDENIYIKQSN